MKVKAGDLAIVISKTNSNYGRFVNVIRLLTSDEVLGYGFYSTTMESWLVSAIGDPLVDDLGRLHSKRPFAGSSLRPIRPDETPEQSIEAMKLLHQLPKETV